MGDTRAANQAAFEKLTRIIHEHILYSIRFPGRLREIALRVGATPEAALSVAIADEIREEFDLIVR